jgi:hypothetical protein
MVEEESFQEVEAWHRSSLAPSAVDTVTPYREVHSYQEEEVVEAVVLPFQEAHPYLEAHPCPEAVPFLVGAHPYPVEAPYLEGIDLDQTCLCSPATPTTLTARRSRERGDRLGYAILRSYV